VRIQRPHGQPGPHPPDPSSHVHAKPRGCVRFSRLLLVQLAYSCDEIHEHTQHHPYAGVRLHDEKRMDGGKDHTQRVVS
jgi:hypothetical protein